MASYQRKTNNRLQESEMLDDISDTEMYDEDVEIPNESEEHKQAESIEIR